MYWTNGGHDAGNDACLAIAQPGTEAIDVSTMNQSRTTAREVTLTLGECSTRQDTRYLNEDGRRASSFDDMQNVAECFRTILVNSVPGIIK
ncbi:MAG: hypothetical protein OWU33_13090 [Firmicutes bacterium]|nr:hypothetical protein [Bacillota bacterium]